MRSSHLLLCTAIAGILGVSVFGQTDSEPTSGEVQFQGAPDPEPAERAEAEFGPAEKVVDEVQALRSEYLQLIEQKSRLMGRDALREAIQGAGMDIEELKAEEKLEQALQLLHDLVNTQPGTRAASKARAMLHAEDALAPFGSVDPINGGTRPTPPKQYGPFEFAR